MQMTRIVTVTVAVLALAALASRAGVLAGRAEPVRASHTDCRRRSSPRPRPRIEPAGSPEAPSAQP